MQDNNIRDAGRPVSPLIVNDLCAQIVPLDRYGLPSLGAAVADSLRLIVGASLSALHSTARCAGG